MSEKEIAGYTHGTGVVAKSPISTTDLALPKKSVLFTQEDERHLRKAGEVLSGRIEDLFSRDITGIPAFQ